MQIIIGSRTVFDGEIDKGCGNQVFDYGKTIQVKGEPARAGKTPDYLTPTIDNVSFDSDSDRSPMQSIDGHPTRSETRLVHRTQDTSIKLPVVESLDTETNRNNSGKSKYLKNVPEPNRSSDKALPKGEQSSLYSFKVLPSIIVLDCDMNLKEYHFV